MTMNRSALVGFFLAFSIVCSTALAFTPERGENEQDAPSNAEFAQEGSPARFMISPESNDEAPNSAAATLELRMTRQTCRGVAYLSQIAQKCQTVSSAPLSFQ